MKKILLKSAILLTASVFLLTSCKKKDDESPDDSIQIAQASDEANSEAEADQAFAETDAWLSGSGAAGGRIEGNACGVTVAADSVAGKSYTLTFSGDNCDATRTRTGQITVNIADGKKWKDANAVLTIVFKDYKVTRKSDSKSLVINGTHTLTNVSGGLLKDLVTGKRTADIQHKVGGKPSITFDDNTKREWTVSRFKTYKKLMGDNFQVTISGDPTMQNVAVTGTNRAGRAFTTVISTPIVVNKTCGLSKPVSGVVIHQGIERELTVTFGVDINGTPATTGCPEKFKLNWINALGKAKEIIATY
ncbi:MAG: hypothetical protein V4714_20700 [Bacteroidota bacterium]